jgi:zinc transport system ATP-binding protein
MDKSILLSAKDIAFTSKGKTILDGIGLELHEAEILTLIGPNGAGKTTLIKILLGLIKASSGEIVRRPDLKIGYVPQRVNISNVLPLRVIDFLKLGGVYNSNDISEVMDEVEISHILQSAIQDISGGEFQRVLLARALLKKPDLLVLDEPAQGVDIIGQQSLYQIIGSIRKSRSCGVLMVSHDLHLVMAATDQVLCLNTHVCCTGHPDHISAHPEYLKLFGSALEGLAVYSHDHDHEHDIHGDVVSHEENNHGSSKHGESGSEVHEHG